MSDFEKAIEFYKESSDSDFRVANKLFNEKEYGYALFFCHLTLEKLLKAIVVKYTDAPAGYIHSLTRLSELAGLNPSQDQIENLKIITKFNIAGRYEDAKWEFRKLATIEYTTKYLKITEELIIWLKENYLKK